MSPERYLTDDELARLMTAVRERRHVHQPRDHAFLALLANTGIRPGEARSLRRRDVCLSRQPAYIMVPREERSYGPRLVTKIPLRRPVVSVLRRFFRMSRLASTDLLFPFSKRQSDRLFRFYADRSGVPSDRRLFSLRHTLGVRLWRTTSDLRLLNGILGHLRLKPTTAYVHDSPERMREAMRQLDTIE